MVKGQAERLFGMLEEVLAEADVEDLLEDLLVALEENVSALIVIIEKI